MRINPFSRSNVRDYIDEAEEEVDLSRRMRNSGKGEAAPRRKKKLDVPEYEEDDMPCNGRGRSQGRGRSRSNSRPRKGRAMTPDARKRLSSQRDSPPASPEVGIAQQDSAVSSVRRNTPGGRKQRRPSRPLSSSPEGERRRGSAMSKASSRRSKSSRAYSLTSSDDDSEGGPRSQSLKIVKKKNSRGQSPDVRGRGRKRLESDAEEEYEEESMAQSRRSGHSRVVPLSSQRRSRSRGVSPISDFEDEDDMPRSRRRKSGSHLSRGSSRGRQTTSRASSPVPMRKAAKSSEAAKSTKSSWGFKLPSALRRKSKKGYDPDVEVESDSEAEGAIPRPRKRDGRDAKAPQAHPPESARAVVKLDEHYVVPKKEAYANLYQYDNFPAIDRVPTAIGYRSDDSDEQLDHNEAGDDNGSFTSRYTVDVKSVRSAKLKKNKRHSNASINNRYMDPDADDNFSHDENDDKYAQYLAGAKSNAVMSDSSESCPPTWHPTLDVEDSDWYDEDEEALKTMKKQQSGNKKYQVSGNKPASKKKKKVPVDSSKQDKLLGEKKKRDEDGDVENRQPKEEGKGSDAIVLNRSEASDVIPGSSRHPGFRGKDMFDNTGSDLDEETGTEGRRRRPKVRSGKKGRKHHGDTEEDEDYIDEDETSLSDGSMDEIAQRSRKPRKNGTERGMKLNQKAASRGKGKTKSLKKKFKNFRIGGRGANVDYASDSDDSSEVSESVRLALSQSMFSEDPSVRMVDPTLAKLEMDEMKESTATHNMIRNNRKELLELDEMDDASQKSNPNAYSCGVFPFMSTSSCFYGTSGQTQKAEIPLDSVQMQRMKDSKHDFENKPKVEVILQDLQDPLAEKFDQLEKMERKKQKEAQRHKLAQEQIDRKEREELLRKKKEMREIEQRKVQMAQDRDRLALQEAPDLSRGKNQSFVMDISDWVLNLDNNDPAPTPKKQALSLRDNHQTPRSDGRDGNMSPVEKLPFSTIEVPTMPSSDSHLETTHDNELGWKRKKKRAVSKPRQEPSRRQHGILQQKNGKTAPQTNGKKKGWFRR